MAQSAKTNSSREVALARRRAMSAGGKAGLPQSKQQAARSAPAASSPVSKAPAASSAPRARASVGAAASSSTARAAALARRKAMSTRGKQAVSSGDRVRTLENVAKSAAAAPAPGKKEGDCGCGCGGKGDCGDRQTAAQAPRRERPASSAARGSKTRNGRNGRKTAIIQSSAKAASMARRKAQSTRGKAGISSSGLSEAQTARAANPQLSGRELARALRDQRSRRGGAGHKKSAPSGRQRKKSDTGAAKDAPWKVGASLTSHDQTVTGTMVGRDPAVTGNEPSTCRTITGTEYMGADVFREFCQAEPPKAQRRAGLSSTGRGNAVTGNEVGRSEKVTGDEPGTCKRVTGSEYLAAGQLETFCGTKPEPRPVRLTRAETRKGKAVTGDNVGTSDKVTGGEAGADRQLTGTQYMQLGEKANVPSKVGRSDTLRGGSVTGTMVGRGAKMTGDEPGSCRNITGDDYVGREQYSDFCEATPQATDRKVGVSSTLAGEAVTGTMTGRSGKVTGDEPGTCKAITGTPYAGIEQYASYCEAPARDAAQARMTPNRRFFGSVMTGQQPGINGKTTGAEKGACETVSGTPYVGRDQAAEACPAVAAEPGAPDFPQPIGGAPWTDFSVEPPAHASGRSPLSAAVTGSQYEHGRITGPFGMADGKVTGTEQARFGRGPDRADEVPAAAEKHSDGRIKSRVTGEGQDAGSKITGDDWDRGDRVTGTEGASAMVRNQSRRGAPLAAMGARASTPVEAPKPVSRVTGSSGNTESGSLITFSGGARG
jgi:hypothetical protein